MYVADIQSSFTKEGTWMSCKTEGSLFYKKPLIGNSLNV